MDEYNYRSFMLNNCLAAVSAIPKECETIAADGIECCLHFFDNCGNCKGNEKTARPYRKLRFNNEICQTTALGSQGSNRVYFLTENFRETGFVSLKTKSSACNCDCGSDCLTDASLTRIGNENFIIGAFRNNAYLFDMNGKALTKLCTADEGEVLTDFISLGNDVFAMGTLCGSVQTVTVSQDGNILSSVLNRANVLRMLIPHGDDVLGLFGNCYIYNNIYRIYQNGILRLPQAGIN